MAVPRSRGVPRRSQSRHGGRTTLEPERVQARPRQAQRRARIDSGHRRGVTQGSWPAAEPGEQVKGRGVPARFGEDGSMAPRSTAPATAPPSGANTVSRCVAFLVYDGVTLLDVAGPAEVFKTANRFGANYQIVLVSPTGEDVTSNLGFGVAVDGAVSS